MISKKEFSDNSLFFEACEKEFLKQMSVRVDQRLLDETLSSNLTES